MAPILIARFILNLQSAAYGINMVEDTLDTANTTTILFGTGAQSALGNLGAVTASWNTSGQTESEDDREEENTWEERHYSLALRLHHAAAT